MPCGYDLNVLGYYRVSWGGFPSRPHYRDQSFEKRLTWIGNCAQIAHFRVHHFDYIKGNVSRYFVEVFSIFIPKKYFGKWYLESIELTHHACYYLGSYPNYWNISNKKIVYAHDLMTSECYSMGSRPEIPGKYLSADEINEFLSLEADFGKKNLLKYLYPERMNQAARDAFFAYPHGPGTDIEDAIKKMAFFTEEFDIRQWLMEKYSLGERMAKFDICIKEKYPTPPKKPQYKIIDPQGAKDFPGIPVSEMSIPGPTAQPSGAPRPPLKVMKLYFSFNVIISSTTNGYSMMFIAEEIS